MVRSRLQRVRSERDGRQGIFYLVTALVVIVVMFIWGLPLVARLAGYLIKPDNTPVATSGLQPTPPIFADVPEATFSASIAISGFSQPGVDVVLYLNGAEFDHKLTADSGTFQFASVPLSDGDNQIYAYATTANNLQSEKSITYTVTVDKTKPVVTLDSPHDGDILRGQSQRIVTFSGSVNKPGSKVYIGDRMVILQSDGKFNLPYQLVEGDQQLQIKAIDKAGNEGDSTIKLTWQP